ncbi:MAG: type III pantothenate kinase [Lysinibacillus sp.]|nr:type III pantothenate kinase [Lysinibacillus sp.]
MILVIDVENSKISLGVYNNDQLVYHWEMETEKNKTADEYGMQIHAFFNYVGITFKDIQGIIISSVVPPIMYTLEEMCWKYFRFKPIVVGPGVKTGLNIKCDNPREVGTDRIVNAVAAVQEYGFKPLIIVDFGTAITYSFINEKGHYLGGVIAPGVTISSDALFAKASKLPRVEIAKPADIIGKNTITSIQAGMFYGFLGQVEGIVSRMKEQSKEEPLVIATGELADFFANETKLIDVVDKFLTLKGLYIIYKRNQQEERK